MEAAIVLALIIVVGWAFTAGKREGSQKAFHAGRECAKRVFGKFPG